MNPLFVLPLLVVPWTGMGATAGIYQAAEKQAGVESGAGALLEAVDALIIEAQMNGLSSEIVGRVRLVREGLVGARESAISPALIQLREALRGVGGTDGVVRNQQQAEVELRKLASRLAQDGGAGEGLDLAKVLLARQTRALAAGASGAKTDGLAAEQEAIALQAEDLIASLSERAESGNAAAAAALAAAKAANLEENARRAVALDSKAQHAVAEAAKDIYGKLLEALTAEERLRRASKTIANLSDQLDRSGQPSTPDQGASMASDAAMAAEEARASNVEAARALDRAAEALSGKDASSPDAAAKALAEAASSIDRQLAVMEDAAKRSLAETAQELARLASEARSLAASNNLAASSQPSSDQVEALRQKAEDLQERAAPLSPAAAGALGEAAEGTEKGDYAGASKDLNDAAAALEQAAAAAAASSSTESRLAAAEAAISQAANESKALGAQLGSSPAGETVAEAMNHESKLAQLAQGLNQAAAGASSASEGQAMRKAAQAVAAAAAEARKSAQSAAQGRTQDSQSANQASASKLGEANASLASAKADLRAASGMASKSSDGEPGQTASSMEHGEGGSYAQTASHSGATEGSSGSGGALTKVDREALSRMRNLPVPPEHSGVVQRYFEALASQ